MPEYSEPWQIALGFKSHSLVDAAGKTLTTSLHADLWEKIPRIVACVNACKGIPTEWLEDDPPYDLFSNVRESLRLLRLIVDRVCELSPVAVSGSEARIWKDVALHAGDVLAALEGDSSRLLATIEATRKRFGTVVE